MIRVFESAYLCRFQCNWFPTKYNSWYNLILMLVVAFRNCQIMWIVLKYTKELRELYFGVWHVLDYIITFSWLVIRKMFWHISMLSSQSVKFSFFFWLISKIVGTVCYEYFQQKSAQLIILTTFTFSSDLTLQVFVLLHNMLYHFANIRE